MSCRHPFATSSTAVLRRPGAGGIELSIHTVARALLQYVQFPVLCRSDSSGILRHNSYAGPQPIPVENLRDTRQLARKVESIGLCVHDLFDALCALSALLSGAIVLCQHAD